MAMDEEREIAISEHKLLELVYVCSTRSEKPKKEHQNYKTAANLAEQTLAGALSKPPETTPTIRD